MVSDDHEGIKAAVAGELPGVDWQRCVAHFMRDVLAHAPASTIGEVAEDLKAIFKVRREKTARALAEEFVELYGERYPKAISVFEAGIGSALTYLRYPGSHHARIRTTNGWNGSTKKSSGARELCASSPIPRPVYAW